jgi:hypothetical protein
MFQVTPYSFRKRSMSLKKDDYELDGRHVLRSEIVSIFEAAGARKKFYL